MEIISRSLPNARQIKSVDTIRFKINGSLFTKGATFIKSKQRGKREIAMGIISISLPNAIQIKSVDTIRFKINGS